jgi:hypothetical protein
LLLKLSLIFSLSILFSLSFPLLYIRTYIRHKHNQQLWLCWFYSIKHKSNISFSNKRTN